MSDRRARVLVFTPSADMYGSDRALLHALPELVEQFEVTVVSAADGPTLAYARKLGAETVVTRDFALRRKYLSPRGVLSWIGESLRTIRALWKLRRREHVDLVYVNTLAVSILPVIRLLYRVPVVVHAHECPRSPRWLPKVLLRSVRWSARLVICNSEYTRSSVTTYEPGLAGRSVVIHNGIELPEPDPDPRPSTTGRVRVVCVARIHPKKGQWVLLDAAAHARDTYGDDWDLHFWGDTLPEHHDLHQRLLDQVDRLGLGDRVTWHGYCEDTRTLYLDADIAVVPSVVAEEFSLVTAEAQAMELPVVATGPGGPSEVLDDGTTGFIVPPDDHIALADKIHLLADDADLRRSMGQAGRTHVTARFDRHTYATHVADALDHLLADDTDEPAS